MPIVEQRFFIRAVKNIASRGDTDIFPLPIENHTFYDSEEKVVDLLSTMCHNFDDYLNGSPPINQSALAPIGYNGYRWATQVDPLWNAYFLGLTLSFADDIEQRRVPDSDKVVFSYRYKDETPEHLFEESGWQRFESRCRELALT